MAERMDGISGVIVDVGEAVGVGVMDGGKVELGIGFADGAEVGLGVGDAVGGIGLAAHVGGICSRATAVGAGDRASGVEPTQANRTNTVVVRINLMRMS